MFSSTLSRSNFASGDPLEGEAPELLAAWKRTERVYLPTHRLPHGDGCKIHTAIDASRPKILAELKDRLDLALHGEPVTRTARDHAEFDQEPWAAWESGDDSRLVEAARSGSGRRGRSSESSASLRWGMLVTRRSLS